MTIKELAQLAGVSVSTVSKVMNQKDEGISAETRERILTLAREYGYSPYSSISSIPSKTPLIGVLLRSQARETCEGIMAQAQVPEKAGIPYLLFQCPWAAESECIRCDSIAVCAVETLLEHYHTSIACLLSGGEQDDMFLEGYKKCLFDHGILPKESLVFHELTPLLLQKISSRQVSGVICSSYMTALELYGKLTSLHYSIPRELSIIAMKDGQLQQLPFPAISCCPVPEYAFGKYLAEKLLRKGDPDWARRIFRPDIRLDSLATVSLPPHMQEERIVVVGSINIDHYLNVEQLPYSGKTVMTTDSLVFPGGKALNQAVGVSRLGHMVTLIGCVGTDGDAEIIDSAMEKYSLDTSGIKRIPGEQTGKAYIFVQKNGESIISILSGANHHLTPGDIERSHSLFKRTKTARSYGAKTILKPSARHLLDPEILKYVDILVPNLDEMNEICPRESSLERQADYFLGLGISAVIVTLGKNGCYMKTASEELRLPAENFLSIDNTGAGDAFISALASYLLYGYEMKDAIRIANLAAGFSVTRRGVAPALIDKSTLDAYIRQKYPTIQNPKG